MANDSKARPRGRSVLARVAIGIGFALGAIVLFAAASIGAFALGRGADYRAQARRLAAFKAEAPAASASLAADLALPDEAPLNRLRYLATHNSYRRGSGPLRRFFIGLVEPAWPAKLAYSHPALRTQLDGGIRSFELDLRARKGGDFALAHVPLVDDRTDEPSLALALEELAIWSDRDPGHAPIILLFELKDDYSFLDPALRDFDAAALGRLDEALRAALGARLVTPDQVRGPYATLRESLAARGWPRLGALRGKFIAVLHENEDYRALYTAGHPTLEGRAMFDCAPSSKLAGAREAAFAILNDPAADGPAIRAALAAELIVRTRADADLALGGLDPALASGAQIVSTDFPPGAPGPGCYVAAMPGGRTLDIGGAVERIEPL